MKKTVWVDGYLCRDRKSYGMYVFHYSKPYLGSNGVWLSYTTYSVDTLHKHYDVRLKPGEILECSLEINADLIGEELV